MASATFLREVAALPSEAVAVSDALVFEAFGFEAFASRDAGIAAVADALDPGTGPGVPPLALRFGASACVLARALVFFPVLRPAVVGVSEVSKAGSLVGLLLLTVCSVPSERFAPGAM